MNSNHNDTIRPGVRPSDPDFEPDPSLLPAKGSISRREFLQWMSALTAVMSAPACVKGPQEHVLPYVKAPEEMVPGNPLFFASAMMVGGIASGVLVESQMGRPTKIEGNPSHPASLGSTDVFAQASILGLYDPDRSQAVMQNDKPSSYETFVTRYKDQLLRQLASQGSGLRLLTETVTSPTVASLIKHFLSKYPKAQWHQYEPLNRDCARQGALQTFGSYVDTTYQFSEAQVVLSLDADFLFAMPGSVRYAKDFMNERRVTGGRRKMSRLYVLEATPTITGSVADHRLPIRASLVERYARFIANELSARREIATPWLSPAHKKWLLSVIADLKNNAGRSLVIVGDQQPAVVHALAHAINSSLGNVGRTLNYIESVEASPTNQLDSIRNLVNDMNAERVDAVVILGGNPVYNAPADLNFARALSKVKFRTHLSLYRDETSKLCTWHIPQAHFLETWSDARAYDGTATILQPLIAPLYDGKSAIDLLNIALSDSQNAYDTVRAFWKTQSGFGDFEKSWRRAIHDGVVSGTQHATRHVSVRQALSTYELPAGDDAAEPKDLEIIFRPDSTVWDGQFSNNGWLQETPKHISKLTWDNALLISPATAKKLDLRSEDVVELPGEGQVIEAPVWVQQGQADNVLTVHLGYGRTHGGRVANSAGFDGYSMRLTDALHVKRDIKPKKSRKNFPLACTQKHQVMEGRDLVRWGGLSEFQKTGKVFEEEEHGYAEHHEPPNTKTGYQWGMTIDLSTCTGCNACVVACQAENNIAIVGKEEVMRGREMSWIRIDTYHEGDKIHVQPVLCMHCENAPCELVCPVNATNHSDEGLNQMVYNRCVGTKYCSNNCPYKVRRFNFYQYSEYDVPVLKLMHNPDVTVRGRGVMEKCSYCVQRINRAKIESEKQDRLLHDGEIVTACQAACPTGAIVFGDINNRASAVAKLKAETLNYKLLDEELNTRPRTTYLARVTNPNSELEKEA